MLLSVIIPTCHRPESLARCLGLLAPGQQTVEPGRYEVIVTDDSANDAAKNLIAKDFSWARWCAGPRRGPAANRNHGARSAHGEWLAFVDDDCEPDPQWLEAIANAIPHGELAVIEGKTICPGKEDNPFQEQVENLNGDLFWSCNLAVRRETFERLGGFDEDFAEAGGEDMEFAWRIRQHHLNAYFAAKAIVVHPPRLISWNKLWWRTFLMRWMLLYRLKTNQATPLDAGPLRVTGRLLWKQGVELIRTTVHFVTRFDRRYWRTRMFFQIWKWLTFPLLFPYLLVWEFRFREQVSARLRAAAKTKPTLAKA